MPEAARDLEGRTYLVTGANSGIGFFAAGTLAARGGKIFLGCRSVEKAEATAAALRAQAGAGGAALALEPFAVDLGDLASVRSAAAAFLARGVPLQPRQQRRRRGRPGLTRDGSSGRLANPSAQPCSRACRAGAARSAPARVVNVASNAHRGAAARLRGAARRGASSAGPSMQHLELCNILFTRELAAVG
jgi:hypothetical protein